MRGTRGAAAPLRLEDQEAWLSWLRKNHAASSGVWLRIAKKSAGVRSVSYLQAVEAALCFGWIDGQKKGGDERYWLQRFTPRSAKSIWSKINREKAIRLIARGQMNAAGMREVERAKRDGRWEGAYDSPSGAAIPADFQAVLNKTPRAKAFFATLDSRNRYAVLFRIQTARKAETRARRIKQFAGMLSQHKKIHP
ncbi:MAG TPA: YdeI/OmpD-associated family protein [Burkholderiales bacterium]|nr:YdeI/OmpD-associated family protein [Burkholderiales bacterium]